MPVNPYYFQGASSPSSYGNYGGGNQLDFSQYQTDPRQLKDPWAVNPSLNLGQQKTGGYGNYESPQLNLNPSQGTEGGNAGGASAGDWANTAAGTAGLAAQTYGMAQQKFHFGNVAPSQHDDNSAPAYTAGQLYNEASGSRPKGAQAGEILSGAGQGAAIGANPALVAATGGLSIAAGAVVGAGASIFGGAYRKNQEQTEKEHALARASVAQGQYNQQDVTYRNHQNQLYDYYNRNNAAGREYNVLKTRFA